MTLMNIPIPNFNAMPDRPVAADQLGASDVLEGSLLRRLRLTAEDLAVLRRQGAVQIEQRSRRNIGKLRFRRGGKQIVRYIGGAEAARQVQDELSQWQAAHRKSRELLHLAKAARAALRESKQALAPCLEPIGYRFHGLAIRRRREPPGTVSVRQCLPIDVLPRVIQKSP